MASETVDHAAQHPLSEFESLDSFQIVCFGVGEETFGLDISSLREVIRVGPITQVPEAPAYVRGLINLRNNVIPVIDLAARFGLQEREDDGRRRIMILRVGERTMGVLVDSVDRIYRISREQIVDAPESVSVLEDIYLLGLVEFDDQLIVLVRLEQLLRDSVAFSC